MPKAILDLYEDRMPRSSVQHRLRRLVDLHVLREVRRGRGSGTMRGSWRDLGGGLELVAGGVAVGAERRRGAVQAGEAGDERLRRQFKTMAEELLIPILVVAIMVLAGCTAGDDDSPERTPALAVRVSDTNATPISWEDLEEDVPALDATGMDEAAASSNGHYVQVITDEERETIENVYESAWAEKHSGDAPHPFAVEREGETFLLEIIYDT